MRMIDYRTILTTKGVDLTDVTDETLTLLVELAEQEIMQRTGLELHHTSHKQINTSSIYDKIILDYYPIVSVNLLKIGDSTLNESDYIIDNVNGLIYLETENTGMLVVEYISGFDETLYNQIIAPLIVDILDYGFDTGWDKDASSISEGSVSISLDTSIGKGALIQSKLNDLRLQFNTLTRMI